MSAEEIVKHINCNVGDQISSIATVEGIIAKELNNDKLLGLIFTMDDNVKTQLKVYVEAGVFKVQLSQLEGRPVRITYLDSNVPF